MSDNTRLPMDDWVTGEVITAEKINKYNTNISNIWIELDNIANTVSDNISIESTQVKYDNGIYFNLKDFLDYINTKVFELNSKDGDIDEEINAIKASINELKLGKISASDISYTKKTYINVKDFLDYLDTQVDNINSNISTIKTDINTNKTNINENTTNIVLNKQAINLVKTIVAQIQEDVTTLKSKKIGADEISYTSGIYLNVKDFLDYLDSTVKKNTESINVLTNENTTNKQAISLIKEKLTAIEEKEITADEIKYKNGEYVNAKDFLDYLGTKIDELSENDTISNETIDSIKSRLKALEDKQLTASDIKYTKGIYTNINDYLDYVDIQLGSITDNINDLNNKLDDKVDKVEGKGLSENDLTTTRLNQYNSAYQHSQSAHAPSDAEANVQSDWNVTDINSDTYIKNKPTIPTKTSELTNDSGFITVNEVPEGHTHTNKDILDTITQEKIDGWESGANIDLSDYATLSDIANKFDNAQLNEVETNDTQIAIDFFSGANKITTVYLPASTGGGGATSSYISTTLEENILVQTNEDFNLLLDFSSPNLGRGTLKVFINDVDSVSTPIPQGESTTVISHSLLTKGTNKIVVYVLDRTGTMSNSLTFYIRYGSTELTSTFDAYSSYDYRSVIRYYFTPIALDTSLALTFYMKIDGATQEGVSCSSDTRGYFTFPSNLEVGRHYCEAWVQDSNNVKSNILTFNLVIIDDSSLVIASDTSTTTVEEGEQLSLDYKVYMKNNSSFIIKIYVDDVLVNTGTCGLEMSYYKTSSLTEGMHTIKLEVWDITETVSDYITWTITVTPSTYEMKTPITAGAMFIASAKNKSNSDEGKEVWVGTNQDGTEIQATLTNFAFNSESGWMNDSLIISGKSHVEIPIKPLLNNARYGFTLDIEFSTKPIGVEDAEVLTLWNEEDNCGIKITTEELIIQSKSGNRADLYFSEDTNTSVMFIIDRDEKTAKIYINGVMCEAFMLSDYEANGVKYLEDFTVDSNVYLGGKDKNGYCAIKNIRIYEVALATDEIINNFIANEIDKEAQKELVEFQKGNDLPTMTIYGDFSGLGKNDKKPCDIVYVSPDVTKYGESFSLTGKTSLLQYQGTSSMAYPIKNYRINLRDANGGKWKYNPFSSGQPEARFCLKADFITSNHAHNTGMAKWISDNLYKYDTKDEKSMNPMKWYSINNGGKLSDTRETINGFPCRLILVNDGNTPLNEGQNEPTPGNTKDMGIFNFNNDKSNTDTMGLDNEIFPRCISYEVTANSDTSAGAFVPYSGNDEAGELKYLQNSFELRYPDDKDVGADYGYLGMTDDSGIMSSDYGLKRVIDWVGNATQEEFVTNFEQYFNKSYTLRYYILVTLIGAVDNLGKNMMLDTWCGKIWYPRWYDIDTILSYDNSGEIKFDVDIEMEQGYWNTSSSRLWTKIRDWMHNDLVSTYKDMRQNGLSYESLMAYLYDEQIAKIPQKYFNMDYDIKYAPFADQYIGKAHGDGYEHMKRWLKRRIIFCDTLFDYAPAYNNDVLTIRANTTEPMTLEIETYSPVYQHLSWYNNQMDKKKIDGKVAVTFTGTAQTATDQEVLIYGGSNIKTIRGISSMNPNSMLIGSATRLTELDLSNCPILTIVNSNKANFSPHTYLNKLDISNCPQLGGTLRLNNSPLIREINAKGTVVTDVQMPTSVRNLEVLRLPNTITTLTLQDASLLNTLEFDDGIALQSISLTNCNNLTNCINFDLTKTPTVLLDNSYNAEELYMSETTNLTLKNMSNLKRVIYTPNNEYEEFDINNVINGSSYKVTTFNNPNMTEFITTAPHRVSYQNGDYGDIIPNTVFLANTLDLSDTQFTDIKFLCTTDLYNLKVPTTMKNFYCDSAMDIDTFVITDASYEVIHDELVEQYTTNYEGIVCRYKHVTETVVWNTGNFNTIYPSISHGDNYSDKIYVKEGSTYSLSTNAYGWLKVFGFDNSDTVIWQNGATSTSDTTAKTGTIPNGVVYIRFSRVGGDTSTITYEKAYTPNIIPSSASGSLIFNMYSNNTTQPTSTSPYMWDLTGLKLNDFYTFGMNNWVKASDDSYKAMLNARSKWIDMGYGGNVGEQLARGSAGGCIGLSPIKVTTGDVFKLTPTFNNDVSWGYIGTDDNFQITEKNGGYLYKNSSITISESNTTRIYLTIYYYNTGQPTTDEVDVNINEKNLTYSRVEPGIDINTIKMLPPIDMDDFYLLFKGNPASITMPQRLPGYSVRMVNADITPNNYANHLYPLLVDTTLPITGKLDYSKYNGTSLAWAYAYTTNDVAITPLDNQHQGNITNDYNKLYGTDYIDIVDVWAYKDDDFSNKNTNEAITKAYIELTNTNYKSRIDEVLQWYPNCTELYLFEDGSMTTLNNLIQDGNTTYRNQFKYVTFMEGYFNNVTTANQTFQGSGKLITVTNLPNNITALVHTFRDCSSLTTAPNIPNGVTNMSFTFAGCSSLTTTPNIPNGVTNMTYTFRDCSSLTTAPNIPNGVTNMSFTFAGCSSLTTTPNIPNGVTNMTYTFSSCKLLTTAPVIPNSVTNMYYTFKGCSKLTTAPNIPNGVTNMEATFQDCSALTTAPTIPNSVTNMKICFKNSNITSAPIIPSSVTNLAFCFESTPITSITYPLRVVSDRAIQSCSKITTLLWEGELTKNFSLSTNLHAVSYPVDSIKDLVNNHLGTVENATLTLGETYLAYLTEDEIASAVAKGWTIQ